jgi:uroporphyrin-III C-methyltransferase
MPDLGGVARSDVLVLYMAGRQLGTIAARLIADGRDPADPVAVIRDATRPEQTVSVTTLRQAADQAAAASPVLIVIGPVVALRDYLTAWQQTSPMMIVNDPQQARIAG